MIRMGRSTFLRPVLWLLLLVPHFGSAHEVRPGFLELRAADTGIVSMFWKLPVLDGRLLPLTPQLPAHCVRIQASVRVDVTPAARIEAADFECGALGLSSGRGGIDGLDLTLIDVLVRVECGGETVSALLKPTAPAIELAEDHNGAAAGAYLGPGIEHILLGFGHLAFVLGLVVFVQGGWQLLKTITVFTVAHSITLAVATLGWIRAPSAPVETIIALSILMLALEILHRDRRGDSLLRQSTWLVAFVFGLRHGFGFAGALSDVGLPADAVPLALLLFNIGVEIGQLIFVGAVLLSARLAAPVWPARVPAAVLEAYAIGVPAAYWSIDRVAGILSTI